MTRLMNGRMGTRTARGGTRPVSSAAFDGGVDGGVDGGWSRRRLLAALIGAATVVVVLLASLGYTLARALDAGGGDRADGADQAATYSTVPGGQQRRDKIAQAPMTDIPAGAVNPTEDKAPSGTGEPEEPDTITVPGGVVPGPAAVLTGFEHTPKGRSGSSPRSRPRCWPR